MKTGINILILALLLASCSPVQKSVNTTDSTTVRTVIVRKDSLIRVPVPADSSIIQALIECDEHGNAMIREITQLRAGLNVKPEVRIVNNTLTAECRVDSFAVYKAISKIYEQNDTTSVSVRTETTRVNYLTWEQKAKIAGFYLLALLLIFFTLYKTFRYVKN